MDNLNDEETFTEVTDFAHNLSRKWAEGLEKTDKEDVEDLYNLCLSLIDELAPSLVFNLPIPTVKAFLKGTNQGHETGALVLCFLTSPSNPHSFRILREIYELEEKPAQAPLH